MQTLLQKSNFKYSLNQQNPESQSLTNSDKKLSGKQISCVTEEFGQNNWDLKVSKKRHLMESSDDIEEEKWE
jgi:hypothetical protein